MKKNLILFFLILFALATNAQWIDSVRVLNKNNLTTNDTIILRAYGYFGDTGWGIDTSWCNVNGNSIDFTIRSCAHSVGLSVIVLYNVNKKVIPLNSGLYNLKVKILGYSNTIINNVSVPCSTIITRDSLMTTFQVNEPNMVKEINILNGMNIYPNPVKDAFKINYSDHGLVVEKLIISNTLGLKVLEIANPQINKEIEIKHLSSGIYFFTVQSHGQLKSYKIIKE